MYLMNRKKWGVEKKWLMMQHRVEERKKVCEERKHNINTINY